MAAYIFDTETTGLNEPVIVEAAWLKLGSVKDDVIQIDGHFLQRYFPGKPIEVGALATHHILDEELVDQPPAAQFSLPEDAEYIIGNNVDYDWQIAGKPDVRRICTLALCRSLWPDADSHGQSAMLYYLSDNRSETRMLLKGAHSAMTDVGNCLRLLYKIREAIGSLESWHDLWLRSEEARIPKIMPFGKHKGMAISQLPLDYKQWLLKQADVDPYLVMALKGGAA